MKKLIYTILMMAAVVSISTSCAEQAEVIANIPTESSRCLGDYNWYVGFADDQAPMTALPTDCDTLFNAAISVTLQLSPLSLRRNSRRVNSRESWMVAINFVSRI